MNKSASKLLSRDASRFSVHTEVYKKGTYASTVQVLGWDRYLHFRRRPPGAVESLRMATLTPLDEQTEPVSDIRELTIFASLLSGMWRSQVESKLYGV